ncbi:ATP-dependent Clp protease proteolytic subunit 4-chloroplastic [Striga hermonthica]|uniref:ATP-dependent Clp protease proteolytic subunit n=1 Tax=Striga hermonthica TaxID=68872 RepID=A0A9N7RPQ2_STRHE|nr:ATP-dependent Clp protease proteolytic subunit 4-chloroplastic [Striga hermonthica]
MASLVLPTPLSHHSPSAARRSSLLHSPKIYSPSLRCSSTASFRQQTLTSPPPEYLLPHISASAAQSPFSSIRSDGDIIGLLLKERIMFLGDEIDDFVADAIVSQMLLLDAQNPNKDIRLFINSPGGTLSSTMAIFDVLRLVRSDVSTIAFGSSASTASIILAGGTKGKRFAMPSTRIMIHQPLGSFSGLAFDVEVQAREISQNRENVIRIYSEITGRSFEQVEKDIDKDKYMSPIEAVEYGIIDGIIHRDSIIPLVPVLAGVKASAFNIEEVSEDPKKLPTPENP